MTSLSLWKTYDWGILNGRIQLEFDLELYFNFFGPGVGWKSGFKKNISLYLDLT